jgi:hypothetical protein
MLNLFDLTYNLFDLIVKVLDWNTLPAKGGEKLA